MDEQQILEAQERATQFVRDYFDEPPEYWEPIAEVGVVGLAIELRWKNDATSVGYFCTDRRYWVQAGLFRAAAHGIEHEFRTSEEAETNNDDDDDELH